MEANALARERWKLLRAALLRKTLSIPTHSTEAAVSVKRFLSFKLFEVEPIFNACESSDLHWLRYKYSSTSLPCIDVTVGLLPQQFTLDDINGFNNTGNVCIWPSEEVMAFYCLENISLFNGKSICELGAGMTGLAGLMLAATNTANEIVLTDGNDRSVDNLSSLVQFNKFSSTSAAVLRWDTLLMDKECSKQFKERFEVVLCADCLFFTSVHDNLLEVMKLILKPSGTVFIFAPDRSGTFELFFKKAEKYFTIQIVDCYHKSVTDKHLCLVKTDKNYDPNIHYPKCAILKLKQTESH